MKALILICIFALALSGWSEARDGRWNDALATAFLLASIIGMNLLSAIWSRSK